MKASSLPVHKLAVTLSHQPDRVTLFIIMRFSVVALAALLGTTYALPFAAEARQDAALSAPITPREADASPIAEADPKNHHKDKDTNSAHEAKKHDKDKHHKEKSGKKHKDKSSKTSRDAEPEAKKDHHKDGKHDSKPEKSKGASEEKKKQHHHKEKEHKSSDQ